MFAAGKTAAVSAAGPDAQFNYVTMLLHGDGTNGAQNNQFLDSSSNAFSITPTGNVTQGSFSPYGSNWSNYFDGSGDYLQLADSTDWDLTGDYTIECWINVSAISSSPTFFQLGSSSNYILWYVSSATKYLTAIGLSSTLTASTAITLGSWNHVALVRSGSGTNNTIMYLNGNNVAQITDNTSITGSASNGLRVGAEYPTGYELNGYISNLRLLKGTAAYSGNFTPSTTPFATSTTNQKLLTCASNGLVDSNTATTAKTITVNGTPSVQRFNPFGTSTAYSTATIGGSGYFDGTGDYLSITDSSALNLGSSSYTMECWVYPTSFATSFELFTYKWYNSGESGYRCIALLANTSGVITAYFNDAGGSIGSSIALKLNAWNHVALVRNGTGMTLYINGVSAGTGTMSGSYTNATWPTYIGAGYTASGNTDLYYTKGYITDFRVVIGTAVYTTTFTPPTAPLTAVSGTAILANVTNGAIYDNAMMNDLETVGNAQISTSVVKYGTGSMKFDGTGDYLQFKDITLSGDFTLECWLYPTSLTGTKLLFGHTSQNIQIPRIQENGGIYIYTAGTTVNNGTASSALATLNTWHHLAITRVSGVWNAFIDGVAYTGSSFTSYSSDIPLSQIGTFWSGYGYDFSGYIDDLRITKGYARYTTTFTPPTAALPDKGPI